MGVRLLLVLSFFSFTAAAAMTEKIEAVDLYNMVGTDELVINGDRCRLVATDFYDAGSFGTSRITFQQVRSRLRNFASGISAFTVGSPRLDSFNEETGLYRYTTESSRNTNSFRCTTDFGRSCVYDVHSTELYFDSSLTLMGMKVINFTRTVYRDRRTEETKSSVIAQCGQTH
jgi:hypothetical protein